MNKVSTSRPAGREQACEALYGDNCGTAGHVSAGAVKLGKLVGFHDGPLFVAQVLMQALERCVTRVWDVAVYELGQPGVADVGFISNGAPITLPLL